MGGRVLLISCILQFLLLWLYLYFYYYSLLNSGYLLCLSDCFLNREKEKPVELGGWGLGEL